MRPSRANWAFAPYARPLRFVGTGGIAGATQLLLLMLMTRHGWNAMPANAVGFLAAAQVNFALSLGFTWRDRCAGSSWRSLPRRWGLFHGSIALMALVNMLTFSVTRLYMPASAASVAGIAAGALGNYLLGDRIVFTRAETGSSALSRRELVA